MQRWNRAGQLTDLLILGDCEPGAMVAGSPLMIGGSAAITAVAAARLGLRVALVASVGDDPAGHFMLSELAREGVNISGVAIRDDVPTGAPALALATADAPGGLLAGARHVHVSSYFRLQGSLGPGLAAMFKAARAGGTTTSLECGTGQSCPVRDAGQLDRVLRQCDVLLATGPEALAISGAASVQAAARALTAADRSITVKLGAGSAMCRAGESLYYAQPPAAAATRTGATQWAGAGDCFDAGLFAGLLRGLALPAAMALGCAVGYASAADTGDMVSCPDLPAAQELARQVTLRHEP